MTAVFEDFKKSASGTLDKAKLVFTSNSDSDVEEQQTDRLEELSEYCPKLSFQQVGNLLQFIVD